MSLLAGCGAEDSTERAAAEGRDVAAATLEDLQLLCDEGADRQTIVDEAVARGWDDEMLADWGVNDDFFARCAGDDSDRESGTMGLTYPMAWDVPEVPNAAEGTAAFSIRYDGVLINGSFEVPNITESEAASWLASVAEHKGVAAPNGSTSIGVGNMMASYQLDYGDGTTTLFRYYHGWGLPMRDDDPDTHDGFIPIPLPAEWRSIPLPEGATYQNAWIQVAYSGEGMDWEHPHYFLTYTDDIYEYQKLHDEWSARIDPNEYVFSGPGTGGISIHPQQQVDTSGFPLIGP